MWKIISQRKLSFTLILLQKSRFTRSCFDLAHIDSISPSILSYAEQGRNFIDDSFSFTSQHSILYSWFWHVWLNNIRITWYFYWLVLPSNVFFEPPHLKDLNFHSVFYSNDFFISSKSKTISMERMITWVIQRFKWIINWLSHLFFLFLQHKSIQTNVSVFLLL